MTADQMPAFLEELASIAHSAALYMTDWLARGATAEEAQQATVKELQGNIRSVEYWEQHDALRNDARFAGIHAISRSAMQTVLDALEKQPAPQS